MGRSGLTMDANFSEDQIIIRETAASFMNDWKKSSGFRSLVESSRKIDFEIWKAFAVDLGFAGLTIPEKLGGSGLGAIERALVAEEMGKVLFMSPYFATCVLTTDLLLSVGGVNAEKILSTIAKGTLTATIAELDDTSHSDTISGKVRNVIDGDTAALIILLTDTSVLSVEKSNTALMVEPVETIDQTRSVCDLILNKITPDLVSQDKGLQKKHLQAKAKSAITLAAEQVGGAEAMLAATVAYVKERKQFGKAIGSFQAIKHRCADMMTAVEEARSAVYLAAAKAETDELIEYAAIAKSVASETFFKVAGDAIQLHGGVGVTWDFDLHFYFKRARAGLTLLDSPESWRERIAESIEHDSVEI